MAVGRRAASREGRKSGGVEALTAKIESQTDPGLEKNGHRGQIRIESWLSASLNQAGRIPSFQFRGPADRNGPKQSPSQREAYVSFTCLCDQSPARPRE